MSLVLKSQCKLSSPPLLMTQHVQRIICDILQTHVSFIIQDTSTCRYHGATAMNRGKKQNKNLTLNYKSVPSPDAGPPEDADREA